MSKTYGYTVTGRGWFPVDMLRYDGAWPRDPEAVAVIDADNRLSERVSVNLLGVRTPTVGRWNSFGWLVENVETI